MVRSSRPKSKSPNFYCFVVRGGNSAMLVCTHDHASDRFGMADKRAQFAARFQVPDL